jgi:hypothetical protein
LREIIWGAEPCRVRSVKPLFIHKIMAPHIRRSHKRTKLELAESSKIEKNDKTMGIETKKTYSTGYRQENRERKKERKKVLVPLNKS